MKRTVLLLIVSLFIVGTLVARVTVPENVMYEVPEPNPESVTDVTEEPEYTTDIVGPVEEKNVETVSLTEMDDVPEDKDEIDLTSASSDIEENQEIMDEPVETETTETSEQPKVEVTEAFVETEPKTTEEVSQPEGATMEDPVDIEVSEDETSADIVAKDVVFDEGNELTEIADEIVIIDEPSEVTEAELEVSEQPEAEVTEAPVETDPEATEEVSQPEDAAKEDSVDIKVSEDETSADVVAQDVVPDEGNEPTEIADEIVTIDETLEVTEAELEVSEQPSAEAEGVSVEIEPEATEEVSQPEKAVMEDSVDIEVSEDETSADVVAQDVVPDEGNEPTEIADEIVTIDETSNTVVNENSPVERNKMKLLVGMEAAHFAWNIGGGRQVAGYPLPCSGIFVAGLFDDRYILGADTRVSYPVNGTTTNANFEVLGRFGMFSPLKRFSNDESVFFAEGDLLLGTAVRSNAGDTSIDPVVGLAGRIHLGREFLTMAIGTDVMVMFPISGADQNPSYTIRPNLSLMWNL